MKFLKAHIFILVLFSMPLVFGQQIETPNLSGLNLRQNFAYFNPSSILLSENGNVSFIHKQSIGTFSIFRQDYFNANLIVSPEGNTKHGVGLRLISDRAGKYISINRLALMYSLSMSLTNEYDFLIGVAPTFISYKKEAKTFGGDSNAGNFDLGFWLKSETLNIGASINQIIPTRLQVISEVDSLGAQFVMNAGYKYVLSNLVVLDFQSLYKINSKVRNFASLGVNVNYAKRFRSGFNYEFSRNIVWLIGLKGIKFIKTRGESSIDFAFGIPASKKVYRPRNVVEWVINHEF